MLILQNHRSMIPEVVASIDGTEKKTNRTTSSGEKADGLCSGFGGRIWMPALFQTIHKKRRGKLYDFPPKPKLFIHRVGRVARAGRTGAAYSFVTPEDMPYLLDLHLFLSKPLRPAPREEVLHSTEEVYSKIDQALAYGETVYGRFPQTVIDLVSERVREVIDNCTELITLQKTCANAFQLYTKTKPTPLSESIKRTKDLPREGLHPIFRSSLGSNELTALAFIERVKSFKPKQTILEFEAEAAKSKNGQTLDCFPN